MWEIDVINLYYMEYGYLCMGYEIVVSLGCKLVDLDKEVYVMVGDGSYLMLYLELVILF